MFKKVCTKIYKKKCLAKRYKQHQAHLWITFRGGNFTLPASRIELLWLQEQELVVRGAFIHLICTSGFRKQHLQSLRGTHMPQRQSLKPDSSKNALRLKLHLSLQRLVSHGKGGHGVPRPGRPAPLWGKLEQILTEGLSRREGTGRRALRATAPGHPPPRARREMRASGSEVKACTGRREAGNGRGGSLSTVPGDGCCVEPGGPCPALERGGAGSCLVWPVSGRCPGPSFQEGCAPPGPPVSLHASPLEEGHVFELHTWPSPDCAQTPQGRSGKIQSKPNTDIK